MLSTRHPGLRVPEHRSEKVHGPHGQGRNRDAHAAEAHQGAPPSVLHLRLKASQHHVSGLALDRSAGSHFSRTRCVAKVMAGGPALSASHGTPRGHSAARARAELHVPAGQGHRALPQARRDAPRPEAAEPAGRRRGRVPEDRGPGPGPRVQHPHQELHARGAPPPPPPPRRPRCRRTSRLCCSAIVAHTACTSPPGSLRTCHGRSAQALPCMVTLQQCCRGGAQRCTDTNHNTMCCLARARSAEGEAARARADRDALVPRAGGAAGRDALLARGRHLERRLHLRRARSEGACGRACRCAAPRHSYAAPWLRRAALKACSVTVQEQRRLAPMSTQWAVWSSSSACAASRIVAHCGHRPPGHMRQVL